MENGRVITAFSKSHGKWNGFYAKRDIELGDVCHATWHNRLSEGLGNFKLEVLSSVFSKSFFNRVHLVMIQSTCELLNSLLPERDPHHHLFDDTELLLNSMSLKEYALWELSLLSNIGYGLDLSSCAITGACDDLFYLSPKTGKCATKSAGEKYKERLFKIPSFWISRDETQTREIYESLKITLHFITKHAGGRLFFRELLDKTVKEIVSQTGV